MSLERRYSGDPVLLDFYHRRLPKAGWAGNKDAQEEAFIRETRLAEGRGRRGRPFAQTRRARPVAGQSAVESILVRVDA